VAIQKKDNIVGPFIGQWYPLNPYASTPFVGRVFDRLFLFPTMQHAMIAVSTTVDNTERMLRHSNADPRLAKSWGRSYGITHDVVRPADLFNLMLEMYAGPILPNAMSNNNLYMYGATNRYPINASNVVTVLTGTRNEDIVYFNYWHDNFLGICACDKCKARTMTGHNMYGAMLMAIRQMIAVGNLAPYVEHNMPKLPTENVFAAFNAAITLEEVINHG
jgi:hypothetical protein